ncbi:hypothetical protein HOS55_gp105 [Pseudomonas phage PMBT3]|uniref:Uncharacterized protein n=1 Tax=Pseudomonas phage PMBT3 TaxID=2059856 RepID=A0A2I6PI76_9CAUD|nr:hypothetical protein HOS55_gp105 [Pseudomonas phage PMBT3]AUM59707.1 hypothetical protein [Pseudomonas phage PMBT3]
MDCYTPPGDVQASRRITGSHLDPDSKEMEAAAMYFAEGLLDAVRGNQSGVRSLIGPARYSDRILEKYCAKLLKSAMGPQSPFLKEPISPALVPYLLGGMTWDGVEALAVRAVHLTEVDDMSDSQGYWPRLGVLGASLGFGPHIRHNHREYRVSYDANNNEVRTDTLDEKAHNHLSFRQDFLLGLPRTGSYASLLIEHGAYDDALRRKIAKWRPSIMARTERLLDPEAGFMPTRAADKRAPVKVNEANFARAVKKVFEQDWDQLDLVCGDPGTALADAEVLMARLLIQKLGVRPPMDAYGMIGMSLLTGISVVNWVQFAVKDKERCGGRIIMQEDLERLIELCEVQAGYTDETDYQLRAGIYAMADSVKSLTKDHWHSKIRACTSAPLWSTNGMYYEHGKGEHGEPTFRKKPFTPNVYE